MPDVAKIAAEEFLVLLEKRFPNWIQSLTHEKGKMMGILVVQNPDNSYGYIVGLSGKIPEAAMKSIFVPSVFDDSVDNYFINKGMTELSEINLRIKAAEKEIDIKQLKNERRNRSYVLQRQLFENYQFSNITGYKKHLLAIFEESGYGNPPSAAGECAAPKLLQFAIENQLKPIAIAEFWYGKPTENNERTHLQFYPACKQKCRPILEYMLEDESLFSKTIF